jgi:hypothetical protein
MKPTTCEERYRESRPLIIGVAWAFWDFMKFMNEWKKDLDRREEK